jgi:hypothetical protein
MLFQLYEKAEAKDVTYMQDLGVFNTGEAQKQILLRSLQTKTAMQCAATCSKE